MVDLEFNSPHRIFTGGYMASGNCIDFTCQYLCKNSDYGSKSVRDVLLRLKRTIVSHLPGGHLPPPKFRHLPPPNSDISHPQKKHLPGGQLPPPIFFFFFWRIFLGLFDLQLMEDIKDGKEEVLDEVVMEHIK